MKSEKYNRQISLMCSTCGGTQFEHDDALEEEMREYRCASCDRIFSHDELLNENQASFEANFQEMGDEILKDAQKELDKSFKKAFRGNKFIKFK